MASTSMFGVLSQESTLII